MKPSQNRKNLITDPPPRGRGYSTQEKHLDHPKRVLLAETVPHYISPKIETLSSFFPHEAAWPVNSFNA